MSQTLRRRADPKRKMDWFCVFCYGDEENARIYAVHLTTANQRRDSQSESRLCAFLKMKTIRY